MKNNHGFSLLEVIIAATILSTALLGVLAVFNTAFVSNDSIQNQVVAMKAVQEVMEQLRVMDYADLPAQDGLVFEFLDIPELDDKNIGLIEVKDVSGGTGNIYEITVSITHPGSAAVGGFSARLISRKAK